MIVPHHLTPPPPLISGKTYTPILLCLIYKEAPPYPGIYRGIFPRLRPQKTPFPEKIETSMLPPCTFEWGGGTLM